MHSHKGMNTSVGDVDTVSRDPGDNKYHCPTCDAAFTRRSNLRRHYAIHTRALGFKCETCKKSFARNDQLTFHQQHCGLGYPGMDLDGRPTSSSSYSPEYLYGSSNGLTMPAPGGGGSHSHNPLNQFHPSPLYPSYATNLPGGRPHGHQSHVSDGDMQPFFDILAAPPLQATGSLGSQYGGSHHSSGIPPLSGAGGFGGLIAAQAAQAAQQAAQGQHRSGFPDASHWNRPRADTASSWYSLSTSSDVSAPGLLEPSPRFPSDAPSQTMSQQPTPPSSAKPQRPRLRRHSTGTMDGTKQLPTMKTLNDVTFPKDGGLVGDSMEEMLGAMGPGLVGSISDALTRQMSMQNDPYSNNVTSTGLYLPTPTSSDNLNYGSSMDDLVQRGMYASV